MVAMVEELVTSWLEEAPPSGAPLGGPVRSKHGRFLGLVVRGGGFGWFGWVDGRSGASILVFWGG